MCRGIIFMAQGDQDGGPHNFGTVIEMREWKGEADRLKFGVRVIWDGGGVNTYRWGAENAWDVQVAGEADPRVDIRALRDSVPPVTPTPPPLCLPEQLAALKVLYTSTGGPSQWRVRAGWSVFDLPASALNASTDPCRVTWDGVMCLKGHIVAL